ncbi:hypothetical protein HK096_005964, partial [Nowakowskiella sp. JEL0078]
AFEDSKNLGIVQYTRGTHITFASASEIWKKHYLQTLVSIILNTKVDVVSAGYDTIFSLTNISRSLPLASSKCALLEPILGTNFLISKSALLASPKIFSDTSDLLFWMLLNRSFLTIPQSLLYRLPNFQLEEQVTKNRLKRRFKYIPSDPALQNFILSKISSLFSSTLGPFTHSLTLDYEYVTSSLMLPDIAISGLTEVSKTLLVWTMVDLLESLITVETGEQTLATQTIAIETQTALVSIDFETEAVETFELPTETFPVSHEKNSYSMTMHRNSLSWTYSEILSISLSYSLETSFTESIELLTFTNLVKTNFEQFSPTSTKIIIPTESSTLRLYSDHLNSTLPSKINNSLKSELVWSSGNYKSSEKMSSEATSGLLNFTAALTRNNSKTEFSVSSLQTLKSPGNLNESSIEHTTSYIPQNSIEEIFTEGKFPQTFPKMVVIFESIYSFPLSFPTIEEYNSLSSFYYAYSSETNMYSFTDAKINTVTFSPTNEFEIQTELLSSEYEPTKTEILSTIVFESMLTVKTVTDQQNFNAYTETMNFQTVETFAVETSAIGRCIFEVCSGCFETDPRDCDFLCPSDPMFNTNCVTLLDIEPAVIPNVVLTKVTLIGTNLYFDPLVTSDSTLQPIKIYVNHIQVPPEYILGSADPGALFVTFSLPWQLPQVHNSTVIVQVVQSGALNPSVLTAGIDLKYYDATKSRIFGSLIKTYVHSSEVLSLQGVGFIRYPEPICVFNVSGSVSAFKAKVESYSLVHCLGIPDIAVSGNVSVEIMYSTPHFNTPIYSKRNLWRPSLFLAQEGSVILQVFEKAPMIIYAAFSNDGGSIMLNFDRSVDILNPASSVDLFSSSYSISCSKMFKTMSPGFAFLSQNDSDCSVSKSSPIKFTLYIKSLFASTFPNAVKPGDLLAVKENTVYIAGATFSDSSNSTITIGQPSKITLPTISVVAPALVPSCAGIQFDLSATSGNLGRKWKAINISFTSGVLLPIEDQNLIQYLESVSKIFMTQNTLLRFTIPSDNISPRIYVFRFSFTNYLGGINYANILVEKSNNADIPILLFNPAQESSFRTNLATVISAQVLPGCINGTVIFDWKIDPNSSDITSFEGSTTSIVALPPFSLYPSNRYIFDITARYQGYSNYSFTLSYQTLPDYLQSSAGSSRLIGTKNVVQLNALIQSDGYLQSYVDLHKSDIEYFSCEWTCISMASNDVNSAMSTCQDSIKLTNPNAQDTVLDMQMLCTDFDISGHLSPGLYIWSVTVINMKTLSSAKSPTSYIQVVEGIVPGVEVLLTDLSPGSWSPSFFASVSIDLDTISSDPSNLIIEWSLPSECDFQQFLSFEINSDTTLTETGSTNLKFTPGLLNPGGSYCIMVNVIDPLILNSGRSNIAIKIRDRPMNGYCQFITQNTGYELESFVDEMTVACEGWTTDSLSTPIFYEFSSMTIGESSSWNILTSASTDNSYSEVQAAGNKVIRVRIFDSAFSPNDDENDPQRKYVLITPTKTAINSLGQLVRRQSDDIIKAKNFITEAIASFNDTGNAISAQKKISVASDVLPVNIIGDDQIYLQTLLQDFLNLLLNSGNLYMDYGTVTPWFSSKLLKVSGAGYNLSLNMLENLFITLQQLVFQSSTTASVLKTCFSSTATYELIQLGDIILGSLGKLGKHSTVVSSEYKNNLKNLETCVSRSLTCGQIPLSIVTENLNRTIGVVDSNKFLSLCGFSVVGKLKTIGISGCFSYSCGNQSGTGIYTTPTSLIEMEKSQILDLTLRNSLNGNDLIVSFPNNSENIPSGGFVFTVKIPENFNQKYSISSFPLGDLALAQNLNFSAKPVCISFDGPNEQPNYFGCEVVNIDQNGKTITFNSSHLTNFAIGVQQIPLQIISSPTSLNSIFSSSTRSDIKLSTSSPSPISIQTNNTGAIAGGVVAGLGLIVIVIGGILFYLRKKREKERKLRRINGAKIITENRAGVRNIRLLPEYLAPPTYYEHINRKSQLYENQSEEISINDRVSSAERMDEKNDVSDIVEKEYRDDFNHIEVTTADSREKNSSANLDFINSDSNNSTNFFMKNETMENELSESPVSQPKIGAMSVIAKKINANNDEIDPELFRVDE